MEAAPEAPVRGSTGRGSITSPLHFRDSEAGVGGGSLPERWHEMIRRSLTVPEDWEGPPEFSDRPSFGAPSDDDWRAAAQLHSGGGGDSDGGSSSGAEAAALADYRASVILSQAGVPAARHPELLKKLRDVRSPTTPHYGRSPHSSRSAAAAAAAAESRATTAAVFLFLSVMALVAALAIARGRGPGFAGVGACGGGPEAVSAGPTPAATPELSCAGYAACPHSFPGPYADGAYPTEYVYGGGFPEGFVWGLGTAAYQIEGGYNEGGRGASIWDTFTGANTVGMPGSACASAPCPINGGMVSVGATGNVACDHYHRFKEDVALMAGLGLKHYRFSIAWPRVVPTGVVADGVNEDGLQFYDDLINELLAAGITPYVTLYHWDLPQALLDPDNGLNGWYGVDASGHPSGQLSRHFVDYADLCFSRYGDRVKTWVTFNEAWTFAYLGSGPGGHAPNARPFNDPLVHPYVCAHNVLLAHAAAVARYRVRYQPTQRGKVGITNNCDWREPATRSPVDVAGAERALLFQLGWLADPVFLGDYPEAMRSLLGDRLPTFTDEERALVKGSADFFGLNHYGTGWGYSTDEPGWLGAYSGTSEEGFSRAQSGWLFASGWGFRKLLNWVDRRYGSPDIFVTEGGWSLAADDAESGRRDPTRTMYYANYTSEMRKAIYEDGVKVKGYFAWSLMDNFEWAMGYTERFGVVFNDFSFGYDLNAAANRAAQPTAAGQRRTLKDTACWFQQGLWATNVLVDPRPFLGAGGCDTWLRGVAASTSTGGDDDDDDDGSGSGSDATVVGVNLGGWLVVEEWFFSFGAHDAVAEDPLVPQGEVFPPHAPGGWGSSWASEGDLVGQLIGALGSEEAAIDAVVAHRESYVTDEDLRLIAKQVGLTKAVRLPLGWWAFCGAACEATTIATVAAPSGGSITVERPAVVRDPAYPADRAFVAVTHTYLTRVLERCAAAGLSVLLDLHAFPGGSSHGSYNGVYPKTPRFFDDPALRAMGLDIVRDLCAFYNGLPPYLKATVSGVTLMNEPAHLRPLQRPEMVAWLADAVALFREGVVAPAEAAAADVAAGLPPPPPSYGDGVVPAPRLFVNFIETSMGYEDMVGFMLEEFTSAELASWAVLDVHHYLAWDPLARACTDTDACPYQCAADLYPEDWGNWTGAVAASCAWSTVGQLMADDRVPLVACTEWSLATYEMSNAACRGRDALETMFALQSAAFAKADSTTGKRLVGQYFWTWRMPFGGSHEHAWSLKHFLTGTH